MAVHCTPITPAFGAEVQGIDLARVTPPQFEALYGIWQKHHLVLLRDQRITREQLESFARMLGEAEPMPLAAAALTPSGDAQAQWHSDGCHLERPPFACVLSAADLPAAGCETWFASQAAALRSMPPALVRRLWALAIRHEGPREGAGTVHPMLVMQPESGEPTLFLGRRRQAYIPGLPLAESERVLNIVWSYATAVSVTLCHRWRQGDVLLWNNLTTLHRHEPMTASGVRGLLGACIANRYPVAAPIEPEAQAA